MYSKPTTYMYMYDDIHDVEIRKNSLEQEYENTKFIFAQ